MHFLNSLYQNTAALTLRALYVLALTFLILPFSTRATNLGGGADQSPLRVLAIGNSFSEDGIENYLHELAVASGRQIIIGNMYIGGAPLSLHLENSVSGNSSYSYRKIGLDGKKTTKEKVSLYEAINDESWDFISFQQASPLSGNFTSIIESLPALVAYVKDQTPQHTRFVYHQTWAYQQNSTHTGFQNYGNSQERMYKEIVKASKKAYKQGFFKHLIPAGTAIQNARTSSLGDTFTRDGYHLQLTYGRFTAACTWFEKLFGIDVRNNSYLPEGISEVEAQIAKSAAHQAVMKPYKVSKIKL